MLKNLHFLALLGHASAASGVTNYMELGDDWPKDANIENNMCDGDHQSPIDLKTSFPKFEQSEEKFFKHYEDLSADADQYSYSNKWLGGGFTTKVDFNGQPFGGQKVLTWKPNYFQSDILDLKSEFKVAQFHFHSRSEHTIDGQRYDFEMHSVHLPDEKENGYFGAVMGIMFDSKKYDPSVTAEQVEIIDNFFDSLKLDQFVVSDSSPVSEVRLTSMNYGQLMNILQTDHRFVYTGSLTTPPCTEKVFWNVVNKVYPIKAKHLNQFKFLITKQGSITSGKMTSEGNYRNVQEIKKQDPKLVVPTWSQVRYDREAAEEVNYVLTIVLVVMAVMVLICSGLIFAISQQKEQFAESKKQAQLEKARASKYVDDEAMEFGPNKSLQSTNQKDGKASAMKESQAKADSIKKMSSANFGSELEVSANQIDGNVGLNNVNPTPSQVMSQHGAK